VGCESCHGPGVGYADIHWRYGDGVRKAEDETPEHLAERRAASAEGGFVRGADVFAMAQNCMSCHTIAHEELVNVGGHPLSRGFDLVSWTQGEVRHNNFFNDGAENPPSPPERQRQMLLLGALSKLEGALRTLASATVRQPYALGTAEEARNAAALLVTMAGRLGHPALDALIAQLETVNLQMNNPEAMTAVADSVADTAGILTAELDTLDLSALDDLLPGPESFVGDVYQP